MSLTPEDRDELATASLLAGRRNRPKGLVIASSCLAVLTGILLLWSAVSLGQSRRTHGRQRAQLVRTQQLVSDLQAMLGSGDSGEGRGEFEPIEQLRTRIEKLATAAGIPKLRLPERTASGQGSIKEVLLKYDNIKHDDIEQVLGWIDSVVGEIPGISVNAIKIDPNPTSWRVDVTFARWESQS